MKHAKPSKRDLLEYAKGAPKLRAWITYRRKDGKGKHSGTIATNPDYIKTHKDWVWQEITLPAPK